MHLFIRFFGRLSLTLLVASLLASVSTPAAATPGWWRGNLHTHSLWSDGDDYPEMIAAWYKEQGYHFLALSDHNVTLEGQRWFSLTTNRGGGDVLAKYLRRFGTNWVEQRIQNGTNQVRLKPLAEFRPLLEEPGRFLLIPAEEITDRHLAAPVHVNATNLREQIPPQGGSNVFDVMQRNVEAVLWQRERTGQPMFPHINHPNFGWGITAEELMRVHGEKFFEVYNGHPAVRNEGDATHASMERMWDIVLTWRMAVLGLPPMFGLAVDDSHNYQTNAIGHSNSGRGWVMLRTEQLTPESIVHALESGDFYASTGVTLKEVRRESERLSIEIAGEPGVTYRTQFIGTRRSFDRANEPVRTASGGALRVTHRYSSEIGAVFVEVDGTVANYDFKGDELYVRAKITSSKVKANPYREGETEAAWTQPASPMSNSSESSSPAERLLLLNRPAVIAHRGYSAMAPENTLPGFERALAAGADLIELDYHHSQDGVPMVIHDSTLDRTTDATNRWAGKHLRVDTRTAADLQTLEAGLWFKPAVPATRLPLLTEAIETIQRGSVTLIERKAGDAATLAQLLDERHLVNHVVVQAFDWEFLRAFHKLEPRQVLGALGPPSSREGRKLTPEEQALNPVWLHEISGVGARIVVWNRQVDAEALRVAHDRGLKVWVYTVNDAALAQELIAAGVDGIITDNPAIIWRALATRKH
jgi:glycerophosphoryl diester phosphodiesterase